MPFLATKRRKLGPPELGAGKQISITENRAESSAGRKANQGVSLRGFATHRSPQYRLAARIREQGVNVFGFGEQKTPESFRQACRRFVYENLVPGTIKDEQNTASPDKPLQPASTAVPLIKKALSQEDTAGSISAPSASSF